MSLHSYSKQEFEARGANTVAARELASELQREVLVRVHQAALQEFSRAVSELNSLGHNLQIYGEIVPGDISYRDESVPGQCHLRLGCDLIISAGYADTQEEPR